jgi:hypothetical protein
LNIEYKQELEDRGINKEYATQLAMASSIKHQRKPDSKPYDGVYLCDEHLIEVVRVTLQAEDTSAIRELYTKFIGSNTLLVFDKNEKDEEMAPRAAVSDCQDIYQFFEKYEEVL